MILDRVDKYGMTMVYIEHWIYDDNLKPKFRRIPTGVKVKPEHWLKKSEKVSKQDSDHENKNKIIQQTYLKNFEFTEKENKRRDTLVSYIDRYIETRIANGTPKSTYKEYITLKNRIMGYEQYAKVKLKFEDINLTFSDAFNIYMVKKKKYKPGTIEKTYTLLQTFLKFYYKRREEIGVSLSDTFMDKDFKHGKSSVNDPHPLTTEDFKKMLKGELNNPALIITRDRFLLQCATGLRYSDLFRIQPQNIINDCIKISPVKTRNKANNVIYIDLNPLSRKILEKYEYDTTKLKISNQKYNENLSALCKELNLSDTYTSHDGRDTFITTCINAGVPVPIILSWTGQESYETMKRYFRIDPEQKKLRMSKISLFKKTKINYNYSFDIGTPGKGKVTVKKIHRELLKLDYTE